jgi:general secretion pathway protein A
MYVEFFGLKEKPFALVPDPRYLYLGRSHREALAHLLYGIEEDAGFIEIVGQVGTGKTTLCRVLVERVGADVELAFIFNPSASELELLEAINREFGLPTAVRTRTEMLEELNRFLLEKKSAGRRVLLVIDEAQDLDPDVMEQIRLLSNLETEREKLLQIVLIGQPELDEMLRRPELRQLRQRITVRWTLEAFDRAETAEYVRHRLRVADCAENPFTPGALRALHRIAKGFPRLINAIADRALLLGFSRGRKRISSRMIRAAARELPSTDLPHRSLLGLRATTASLLLGAGATLGLGAVAWQALSTMQPPIPAVETPVVTQALPPPPPPAPPPPPPPPDPLEGLAPDGIEYALLSRDAPTTAALALDALLDVWGYPPLGRASLSPNLYANAVREIAPLRVLSRHATREQVAALDLPLIIELEPQPDQLRYATLLGLEPAGGARVRAGGAEFSLSRGQLDRLWTGRGFFLWSNFESVPALAAGMNGTAVRWLQARLTDLEYMQRGDATGDFDERTIEALRRFQTSHGLEATGDVGPETLIALYQVLRYGAPRLADTAQTADVS